MATQSGPVCEDPMHGVCFIVEKWERNGVDTQDSDAKCDKIEAQSSMQSHISTSPNIGSPISAEVGSPTTPESPDIGSPGSFEVGSPQFVSRTKEIYGPISGQIMVKVKDCCRRAFQAQPQRLMWAMYTCVIQAGGEILGNTCSCY